MGAIGCIGIGLGIYQHSKRWADDWAFDRREAGRHRHEASFYARVRADMEANPAEPSVGGGRIRVIHGLVYWDKPDLKRYVEAMISHHDHEAGRHAWAIGRRWAYVSPTPVPQAPPLVPAAELKLNSAGSLESINNNQ